MRALPVADARAQTGIGVIAPRDFLRDRELWRWVPADVSLHLTRLPIRVGRLTVRTAHDLADREAIREATLEVLVPEPAVVVYACAAGSFVDGANGERAVCRVMSDAGASAVMTTSGALVEELRRRGLSRLGLVTPYPEPTTRRLVAYLREHGVDVVRTVPFGRLAGAGSGGVVPRLRAQDWRSAEAVFLCCSNVGTYDLVAPVEAALDVPVLSANEVLMRGALRALAA